MELDLVRAELALEASRRARELVLVARDKQNLELVPVSHDGHVDLVVAPHVLHEVGGARGVGGGQAVPFLLDDVFEYLANKVKGALRDLAPRGYERDDAALVGAAAPLRLGRTAEDLELDVEVVYVACS